MAKLTKAQVTQIVVLVALVVVLQVIPASISATSSIRGAKVWSDPSIRPSASPPSIVFAVVWPILYLLVAGGLTLQTTFPTSASPAVQWTGTGLVAAAVLLTFIWTPIFVKSTVKAVKTATYLIVAMLALLIPGLVLCYMTRPAAGALLTPLALWLIFALVLSFQTLRNLKRRASISPA